MINKKDNGKVVEMTAPVQKIQPSALQLRLSALAEVGKKMRVRTHFQTHLDQLNAAEIENPEIEAGEDRTNLGEIVLKFGYNDSYKISSPALLLRVRDFLKEVITARLQEVEAEIEKAEL